MGVSHVPSKNEMPVRCKAELHSQRFPYPQRAVIHCRCRLNGLPGLFRYVLADILSKSLFTGEQVKVATMAVSLPMVARSGRLVVNFIRSNALLGLLAARGIPPFEY